MRRSQRAREKGFSLTEIILLLILVGIIAALAIPRFVYPKAGAAARRLSSDIQYAKELAIRQQTMSGVFFIDPTSYRVFENDDTSDAAVDPVGGGDLEVTMSGHFSGVTLSQSFTGNTLKFNSLGTPLDGNDVPITPPVNTITVTFDGETRTVTVEPNTGKVTVS